jgi:hypothetical protein
LQIEPLLEMTVPPADLRFLEKFLERSVEGVLLSARGMGISQHGAFAMNQKDKHDTHDDGRKQSAEAQDGRGQQGQRDRSRDSESAGQSRPMQSGQHQPGQQQAGQRQPGGQQQAGHGQASQPRHESGQHGSGSGNKPNQGGGDRDKDRQR